MPEQALFRVNSHKHSISVGLVEGALGIAFLPSTDGALDGVDVPQEKELALLLQRATQSYLPPPIYGPVRPERLRCQKPHQHARMFQGVRPNSLHPQQRYRPFPYRYGSG